MVLLTLFYMGFFGISPHISVAAVPVPGRLPLQLGHIAVRQGGGCELRGGRQRDQEPGRGVHPAHQGTAADILPEVDREDSSVNKYNKVSVFGASLVQHVVVMSSLVPVLKHMRMRILWLWCF